MSTRDGDRKKIDEWRVPVAEVARPVVQIGQRFRINDSSGNLHDQEFICEDIRGNVRIGGLLLETAAIFKFGGVEYAASVDICEPIEDAELRTILSDLAVSLDDGEQQRLRQFIDHARVQYELMSKFDKMRPSPSALANRFDEIGRAASRLLKALGVTTSRGAPLDRVPDSIARHLDGRAPLNSKTLSAFIADIGSLERHCQEVAAREREGEPGLNGDWSERSRGRNPDRAIVGLLAYLDAIYADVVPDDQWVLSKKKRAFFQACLKPLAVILSDSALRKQHQSIHLVSVEMVGKVRK